MSSRESIDCPGNNKPLLAACLFFLGGALLLGGGIALVLALPWNNGPDAEGNVLADLDKQALVLLGEKNKVQQPVPAAEEKKVPLPQPVVFVPKPPASPPVFEVPPPMAPLAAVPAPSVGIPGALQKRIDAAIDKGVSYLKAHQNLNGTWGKGAVHSVGYTALPGLTLLECGVSPKDPVVRKAAAYVRNNVPKLANTYELSLAILFLDRLGEPRDKALIKAMAMRLVAGQTAAGGWNYTVPLLVPSEMDQLYAFLEKTRPRTPFQDPLTNAKTGINPLNRSAGKTDSNYPNPLTAKDGEKPNPVRSSELPLPQPIQKPNEPERTGEANRKSDAAGIAPAGVAPAAGIEPFNPDEKNLEVPKAAKPAEPKPAEPKPALPAPPKKAPPKAAPKKTTLRPDFLPPNLQNVPAVANQGKAKGKAVLKAGRDDNSNSQFAMLALWAARRHGVPADMTLMLAYQRYLSSQQSGGGWGYMVTAPGQTPSMTCVGLLGLAMGHGSAPDMPVNKGPKLAGKTTNEDPAIQEGLKALGRYVGTPLQGDALPPMENLYFLWSVERVAVLYNLKTIGGKDWYGWGAQILLPNQHDDGSWLSNRFHGSAPTIDTCFALLFLKRSNLVQDLTDNLQLLMAITDPDKK